MYGLVGGEANSVQPGKRMLSSMTPTIIEKEWKTIFNRRISGRFNYTYNCLSGNSECD